MIFKPDPHSSAGSPSPLPFLIKGIVYLPLQATPLFLLLLYANREHRIERDLFQIKIGFVVPIQPQWQ